MKPHCRRTDWHYEDGWEEPPVTRSERAGYLIGTVVVVLALIAAVFA